MKKLGAIAAIMVGLVAGAGCTRQDEDRTRSEGREARENAQRQLDEASRKVREELKHADQQTREDLNQARDQVRHALSQSERDAEKARDRLRDRTRDDSNYQ